MFEIICYREDQKVSTAEAETSEDARLAARTLWDEAWTGNAYCKRKISFYMDGKHIVTTGSIHNGNESISNRDRA